MKHPTPEELMEHLYAENPPARRQAIDEHLGACPACLAQIEGWRGAMQSLDAWKLPARPAFRIPAVARRFIPAAAAAAVLLAVGIALGRQAGPAPAELRAAVRQELASQLTTALQQQRSALAAELRQAAVQTAGDETRRLLTGFAEQLDERRESDSEVFYTTLQQLARNQAQEVARLRRDLGTVAVVADARLTDTQEKLFELATASPSDPRK